MPAEYLAASKQKQSQKPKPAGAGPPSVANKKNPVPGLLNVTTKFEAVKKPRFPPQNATVTATASPAPPAAEELRNSEVNKVTEALENTGIDERQEISKKLKKLRKKIREIEEIETKQAAGESKRLEKDQAEKIRKKAEILAEIKLLEEQRRELK